jgi:hypothetical protein
MQFHSWLYPDFLVALGALNDCPEIRRLLRLNAGCYDGE